MSYYAVSFPVYVYCYVLQVLCGKSDSCCTCTRSNIYSKEIDNRKLVLSIYIFLCARTPACSQVHEVLWHAMILCIRHQGSRAVGTFELFGLAIFFLLPKKKQSSRFFILPWKLHIWGGGSSCELTGLSLLNALQNVTEWFTNRVLAELGITLLWPRISSNAW